MVGGKDTAAKTKPLISKENAQNRPETIQRDQVLGVSAFREQIGNSAVKRRCSLCPVCRNISRKNGRSFLMSVAGRNITSFAENAKGAASRASVPPLSNGERRSAAPHRNQKSINPPTQITGAFKLLDKASVPRGTGAILCLRETLSAIDSSTYIVPVWMI